MAETLLTKLNRSIRTAGTRVDAAMNAIDRGWDKEAMHILRTHRTAIVKIGEGVDAAVKDQVGVLRERAREATCRLANERYRNNKHPTTELLEHAVMHAQDMAALVDKDRYGNEVNATLGLLKILLDESNGIKPPKCGYNGNDPVGEM